MARQKETAAKSFILAAERHKNSCEKLLNLSDLDNIRHGTTIINQKQKSLLADTFYLSGYIIECACCSAIYSHYNLSFKERKNQNNDFPSDKSGRIRSIKFKSSDVNVFSITGDGEHSILHFANFPSFFENPNIPLLNGDISIFNTCNDLFEHFRAEIRYVVKKRDNNEVLLLHYENVLTFYQAACDIFERVKKHYKP